MINATDLSMAVVLATSASAVADGGCGSDSLASLSPSHHHHYQQAVPGGYSNLGSSTPTSTNPNNESNVVQHYYQMHHNHSAHAHAHAHPHTHGHVQNFHHLMQHHYGTDSSASPSQAPLPSSLPPSHHHHHHQIYSSSTSRPGSATTPTTVMGEDPSAGAETCSSVSSTTIFATRICNRNCRCTNRLLTGAVITILPIAITSTLLFVFMMQKTNLHQYAIYSFIIFCVAFVFPFALFFFTVILNKIYKFYKRGIRTPAPEMVDGSGLDPTSLQDGDDAVFQHDSQPQSLSHNHGHYHHSVGQNQAMVYYQPYYFTTMTYQHPAELHCGVDGTVAPTSTTTTGGSGIHQANGEDRSSSVLQAQVTIDSTTEESSGESPQQETPGSGNGGFEDSPPSYEMALLCPSVTNNQIKTQPQFDQESGDSDKMKKTLSLNSEEPEMELGPKKCLSNLATPSTSRNPSQEEPDSLPPQASEPDDEEQKDC